MFGQCIALKKACVNQLDILCRTCEIMRIKLSPLTGNYPPLLVERLVIHQTWSRKRSEYRISGEKLIQQFNSMNQWKPKERYLSTLFDGRSVGRAAFIYHFENSNILDAGHVLLRNKCIHAFDTPCDDIKPRPELGCSRRECYARQTCETGSIAMPSFQLNT